MASTQVAPPSLETSRTPPSKVPSVKKRCQKTSRLEAERSCGGATRRSSLSARVVASVKKECEALWAKGSEAGCQVRLTGSSLTAVWTVQPASGLGSKSSPKLPLATGGQVTSTVTPALPQRPLASQAS